MTDAATVLDYASPHTHGAARLPARSVLTYQRTADGGVIVLETLTGKSGAIGAMVFSGLSLALLMIASIAAGLPWQAMFGPGAFALAGAIVMGMVVNQTWRRTILRGTSAGIELSFLSPLQRARLMQWPADQVHAVMPVYTADERLDDEAARGELNIVISRGPLLRLFTGHAHAEMAWIADCIRMAMESCRVVE
jgi:hypothetical protein